MNRFRRATRTWLEDRVLTRPLPWHGVTTDAKASARASDIRSQGFTPLGKVFDNSTISEIRDAISRTIEGEATGSTATWQQKVEYWLIEKPLNLHPALLELAASRPVVNAVEAYFGRRCYLADVDVRRVMPIKMEELECRGISSSNWHRDNRGRQVKLMAYLTNVTKHDSCFSLYPSTHHGQGWRKGEYMETRFTDAEMSASGIPKMDWHGEAGEAMLFDTNLIHKLTRRDTAAVRDTVTFYFTPGQALAPISISDKPDDPTALRLLDNPKFFLRPRG